VPQRKRCALHRVKETEGKQDEKERGSSATQDRPDFVHFEKSDIGRKKIGEIRSV